jgi:hypothetical protein
MRKKKPKSASEAPAGQKIKPMAVEFAASGCRPNTWNMGSGQWAVKRAETETWQACGVSACAAELASMMSSSAQHDPNLPVPAVCCGQRHASIKAKITHTMHITLGEQCVRDENTECQYATRC